MYNINICLQVARYKSTVRARIHTCGPMERLCIKEPLSGASWHCSPWKMNSVTFCINCLSDLTAYELNLIPDCSNFDSWLYNVLYIYYLYSVLVVTVHQHNTHLYLVITLSSVTALLTWYSLSFQSPCLISLSWSSATTSSQVTSYLFLCSLRY